MGCIKQGRKKLGEATHEGPPVSLAGGEKRRTIEFCFDWISIVLIPEAIWAGSYLKYEKERTKKSKIVLEEKSLVVFLGHHPPIPRCKPKFKLLLFVCEKTAHPLPCRPVRYDCQSLKAWCENKERAELGAKAISRKHDK